MTGAGLRQLGAPSGRTFKVFEVSSVSFQVASTRHLSARQFSATSGTECQLNTTCTFQSCSFLFFLPLFFFHLRRLFSPCIPFHTSALFSLPVCIESRYHSPGLGVNGEQRCVLTRRLAFVGHLEYSLMREGELARGGPTYRRRSVE